MTISKNASLIRGLGIVGLSATIFNCLVGGGIFRLPGMVFAITQTWTPYVYLICGFLMILIGFCFAIVGRQTMETGGPYAYAKQAFGPLLGFIAGALLWTLGTFSMASVTDALLSSIKAMYPAAQDPSVRTLFIVIIFGALVYINTQGIKRSSLALGAVTILKLSALLVLIAAGAMYFKAENVAIQQPFNSGDFTRTCMILIFAYMGVESAIIPGGEIKNPGRTVPISIVLSLVLVTVLYFVIQLVCQSILGSSLTEHADAPLVYAGEVLLGKPGKAILVVGSLFSMFGFLMGMMLAVPRVIFSLAEDGYLPKILAGIDGKKHVPVIAIILQGCIVAVFAITGSFNSLAIFANLSTILLYMLCIGASAKIYFGNKEHKKHSLVYNTGISLIMIVSILIMSWFLTSIQVREWIWMGAICGLFLVVYGYQKKLFKNKSKA